MLDKMTLSLARTYYAGSGIEYDEDDVELYSYGLQTFLEPVIEIATVLIISLLAGRFFETVAFLGAFCVLRFYAGGYHAKNFSRCFMGLLVVYGLLLSTLNLAPLTAMLMYQLSLVIVVISIVPILRYAPVAHINKPIGPITRKQFRKRSIVILATEALIIVGASVYGIAIHHAGYSIAGIIPYILLSFAVGLLTASGSLVTAVLAGKPTYEPHFSQH